MAANAGDNRRPFIDVHEDLTTTLQKKFLEYVKLLLDPTPDPPHFPTAQTNIHRLGKQGKRGKRDMETEDGYPVMPEVDETDRKDDLEDLLRHYLTAQYSEFIPDGLQSSQWANSVGRTCLRKPKGESSLQYG